MEIIILIIIGILFVIPSFMAMRKQRQRQNDMQALQNSLKPGDSIVTAGGVHGVVRSTSDKDVDLEIAPGVVVTFDKMAVIRTEQEAKELERPAAAEEANGDAEDNLPDGNTPPFDGERKN